MQGRGTAMTDRLHVTTAPHQCPGNPNLTRGHRQQEWCPRPTVGVQKFLQPQAGHLVEAGTAQDKLQHEGRPVGLLDRDAQWQQPGNVVPAVGITGNPKRFPATVLALWVDPQLYPCSRHLPQTRAERRDRGRKGDRPRRRGLTQW